MSLSRIALWTEQEYFFTLSKFTHFITPGTRAFLAHLSTEIRSRMWTLHRFARPEVHLGDAGLAIPGRGVLECRSRRRPPHIGAPGQDSRARSSINHKAGSFSHSFTSLSLFPPFTPIPPQKDIPAIHNMSISEYICYRIAIRTHAFYKFIDNSETSS